MAMAISRTCTFSALLLVLSTFFLSLTLQLPLQSGGIGASMGDKVRKKIKMALGSKPPACVNRCMSCRPCEAILVIPYQKRGNYVKSSHAEDDTYYLLSWKCRCRNKLYQP